MREANQTIKGSGGLELEIKIRTRFSKCQFKKSIANIGAST